jgi:hypothetical protein
MKRGDRRLVISAAVVLAVGVGGFTAGAMTRTPLEWHEVTAEVIGEVDHPLVNFEYQQNTWAIRGNIAYWIDATGGEHDQGWPTCLLPSSSDGGTQRARRVPIRFAALGIDGPEGHELRKVVAVDCRPRSDVRAVA